VKQFHETFFTKLRYFRLIVGQFLIRKSDGIYSSVRGTCVYNIDVCRYAVRTYPQIGKSTWVSISEWVEVSGWAVLRAFMTNFIG